MIVKPTLRPMPARMAELWEWVCAAAAHDSGDAAPLARLIEADPVPDEFRPMVAAIVAGLRPLKRKGKGNAKIAPSERLRVAATVSVMLELCDLLRTLAVGTHGGKPGADSLGEQLGREPADIVRELQGEYREAKKNAARDLRVSVETVEDLVRELQSRIDRWPTV